MTQVLEAINPVTLPLVEGLEAFCFFGFSALGLRTSRFVFFWLLAIFCLLAWPEHNGQRQEPYRGACIRI
jgi:hypothetical protein